MMDKHLATLSIRSSLTFSSSPTIVFTFQYSYSLHFLDSTSCYLYCSPRGLRLGFLAAILMTLLRPLHTDAPDLPRTWQQLCQIWIALRVRCIDSTTLQALLRPSWPNTQLHGGSQSSQLSLASSFPLLLRHLRPRLLHRINRINPPNLCSAYVTCYDYN